MGVVGYKWSMALGLSESYMGLMTIELQDDLLSMNPSKICIRLTAMVPLASERTAIYLLDAVSMCLTSTGL